jgi:hypothetical protein
LLVTLPAVDCAVREYVAMKGDFPESATALPVNGTEPEVSPVPTNDVATKPLPLGLGAIANLPNCLPIAMVAFTPDNTFHTSTCTLLLAVNVTTPVYNPPSFLSGKRTATSPFPPASGVGVEETVPCQLTVWPTLGSGVPAAGLGVVVEAVLEVVLACACACCVN